MKNSIKLKTLVSLTFIFFSLPFLRTCSDRSIDSFPRYEEVETIEEGNTTDTKKKVLSLAEIKEQEKIKEEKRKQSKKENTYNLYELLYTTFIQNGLQTYDKETFQDKTFYPLLGFLLILLNSVLLWLSTFLKKYKSTYIFGILNLSLLGLSTLGLILSGIVDSIDQFKIGYFLFVLNSISIIFLLKKELNLEKNKDIIA